MTDIHSNHDIGGSSIIEINEHGHLKDDETLPSGKNTILLGLGTIFGGLISLASAGFAQQLPIQPLSNRKSLMLFNSSNQTVWLGSSSLASGTGIPLYANERFSGDIYEGLYAVPTISGQTINVLELA